jgi:hypothetical protein
VRKESI